MRPLLGMSALGFAGYGLLMPIAPMWAVQGGADEAGAGSVNAVLMLATVVAQIGVHPAIRTVGWRATLTVGMLALGLPSLAFVVSDALWWILVLSAVRGIGFAVLTVGGASAVAELVDASERGRAVGLYGVSIALPQLLLVPAGPVLTHVAPPWLVFVLGSVPVAAVPLVLALGARLDARAATGHADEATDGGLGRAILLLAVPSLALLAVTTPGGALLSFAPQLTDSALVAAIALLGFTGTTMLARWLVGGIADRSGPFLPQPILLGVGAVGLACTAWAVAVGDEAWLVGGMLLAGIAYGGIQNVTLVAAFAMAPRRRDLASTVWNIGFDAGTGAGSLVVGAIAAGASFTVGLAWTAVGCVVAAAATAVLAWRRRAG